MDIAKQLTQWREQSPEEWIALANRILPPVVALVLVILFAVQAAELTWRLLEAPAEQDFIPGPAISNSGAATPSSIAVEPILGLFGQAPEPEAGGILSDLLLDAPDTDLNLVLHGVLVAQELPERGSTVLPELGIVIIAAGRAAQNTYVTGDEIDGVAGTTLHSVADNCAYLDRGHPPIEKLCRDESQSTVSSLQMNSNLTARVARTTAAPPPPPQANVPSAAALTAALGEVPAALLQHMSFEAQTEGNRIIGFRVQPRGQSTLLSSLGLEAGDVLVEVNGLRLNDARDSAAVLSALMESNQANVTIRRNGEDQVKVLDMGQLQRLTESRQ